MLNTQRKSAREVKGSHRDCTCRRCHRCLRFPARRPSRSTANAAAQSECRTSSARGPKRCVAGRANSPSACDPTTAPLARDQRHRRRTRRSDSSAACRLRRPAQDGDARLRCRSTMPHPAGPGTTTALGSRKFDGVPAQGKKTTWTIGAGSGRQQAADRNRVGALAFARLNIVVLSRHADPRSGERIYRLENIIREEPNAELFKVPADYALKTRESKPEAARRRTQIGWFSARPPCGCRAHWQWCLPRGLARSTGARYRPV